MGLEGGQILKGYVPQAGRSGVTIATGFDIGQISYNEDLLALKLPDNLTLRLKPYVGEKLEDARRILDKFPLVVTKDEADLIDAAVWRQIIGVLARGYTQNTGRELVALPKIPLTVICSLAWNGGANFRTKWPRAWDWIKQENWPALQYELENFYPNPTTAAGLIARRKREAEYLSLYTGLARGVQGQLGAFTLDRQYDDRRGGGNRLGFDV